MSGINKIPIIVNTTIIATKINGAAIANIIIIMIVNRRFIMNSF